MANTSTLAAMRTMVTGNEGGESVPGGGEVRIVCACCRSQAGQLRDEDESPKLRSNSLPHVAHRCRDKGHGIEMVTGSWLRFRDEVADGGICCGRWGSAAD